MTITAKIEKKGAWKKIVVYANYPQEDGTIYSTEIMTLGKCFQRISEANEMITTKEFKALLKNAEKMAKLIYG